jgi:hypothetical protein
MIVRVQAAVVHCPSAPPRAAERYTAIKRLGAALTATARADPQPGRGVLDHIAETKLMVLDEPGKANLEGLPVHPNRLLVLSIWHGVSLRSST